jgi:hypothetical protein
MDLEERDGVGMFDSSRLRLKDPTTRRSSYSQDPVYASSAAPFGTEAIPPRRSAYDVPEARF